MTIKRHLVLILLISVHSAPLCWSQGAGGSRVLVAEQVKDLPGFVRSPYTSPPRLVDVKGAPPGSTMICPYTQRPFLIPGEPKSRPATTTSLTAPQAGKALTLEDVVDLLEAGSSPEEIQAEVERRGYTDRADASTLLQLKEAGASRALLAALKRASDEAAQARTVSELPVAPQPKPVQEIPWGTAIAGRPGFVNSPFTPKHQIIDVTGLPTGMEVKCPYTGKLFRVPSQSSR